MIITCPGCGRRFNLERRPPATFRCPKCAFTAPFSSILNENNSSEASFSTQDGQISLHTNGGVSKTKVVSELANTDHTRVVSGLANDGHTSVVPALQPQQKKAAFAVTFQGHPYATIPLPFGNFELGRNSSDSKAKVRLTPDMAMSRVHAGMRTTKINGQIVYQITSVKNENPVYVNNTPIAKGKAYNLKNGDQVRMGDTIMIFRIM
ncbi:MAG: FHA domain-containing protein [Sodaliphilus sp.]